jgi:hypothetical protein
VELQNKTKIITLNVQFIYSKFLSTKARGGKLLVQYWKFAKFMFGEMSSDLEHRSIFLVIAKTAYGIQGFDFLNSMTQLSEEFLSEVYRISPSVARDLWMNFRNIANVQVHHVAERFGLEDTQPEFDTTIAEVCGQLKNPFYEEENLLNLAKWLLSKDELSDFSITPWNIRCSLSEQPGYEFGKIGDLEYIKGASKTSNLFKTADWCETKEESRKLRIGLLLRYALRGITDFYSNFQPKAAQRISKYRKPICHWEQQRYSGYQGRSAFGPSWLPISSFTEDLLFQLLRWPGSGIWSKEFSISELLERVKVRFEYLGKQRGQVTSTTFLEQKASYPTKEPAKPWQRNLRVGIVQSIIPSKAHYKDHLNDPELLRDRTFRRRQRAHLASIMEGVAQMLRIRETHRQQNQGGGHLIDLLIFPELAIHPQDIEPLLLPFVRKHKCMMLFGQVYHPKDLTDSTLINSCLWIIPEWNSSQGFHLRRIEQGKCHLTQDEEGFTPRPRGFRPAQWLIEYEWQSDKSSHRPLILSASVCYDATDIKLAADLRCKSDLYIICALNQDVGTFDRMSEGLHYHMFQGVIVVNNGEYGGSSFYLPFKEQYNRQIFHLHGQPQASIAFVEISAEKLVNRPDPSGIALPDGQWKTSPAGWVKN